MQASDSCWAQQRTGNTYTACLFVGLAGLLCRKETQELEGKRILMFGFGSGLIATMYCLAVHPNSCHTVSAAIPISPPLFVIPATNHAVASSLRSHTIVVDETTADHAAAPSGSDTAFGSSKPIAHFLDAAAAAAVTEAAGATTTATAAAAQAPRFTLQRLLDRLHLEHDLAARVRHSAAEFAAASASQESMFGTAPFVPTGDIGELLSGTFYLAGVDKNYVRTYTRVLS